MLFGRKRKVEINSDRLPRHVGIIMDGNGRWAKKRGLPRSGIEYVTVYAFSTENWKRPADEVKYLMSLLLDYLKNAEKNLAGDNTVIRVIGSRTELSEEIQEQIIKTEKLTEHNTGTILNIALNYGGREEIAHAVREICADVTSGALDAADIDEDLLIRTSGEMRLSNFMLWQVSYAEMWFTDKLWPDFKPADFRHAVNEFGQRGRRFGGI